MSDVSLFSFFLHRPRSERPYACVPMGVLYLAAALQAAGYDVDFHDYQVSASGNPYTPESVTEFLMRARSDVLGISCMANMLPYLVLGLRRFKREHRDAYVVLGGAGPSGLGRPILERIPEVDAVVRGEGEEALVQLLAARAGRFAWDHIQGLHWRDRGCVRSNALRARRLDIGSLPWPAYDLLDREHYIGFPVISARGCSYRCAFCDIAPNAEYRVSMRAIDDVLDEIAMLQARFNATEVTILDDTFSLAARRVLSFCARVRERRMDFTWGCMCRVDGLDDAMIDVMESAGCRRVFFGIESGSRRVRRLAGKGLRHGDVEAVIAKTASRFDVAASFILGFPFETLDEFRETLWLSIYSSSQGAHPQMSVLSPLPQATLTRSSRYRMAFSRELISGIAYARHGERAVDFLETALSPEVEHLIRGDSELFSAFYHFVDGQVEKKLDLARMYGVPT